MRSAADTDTPVLSAARQRVQDGTAHDPFEVLGLHTQADGSREISVFLPPAEVVQLDGVQRRISLMLLPEAQRALSSRNSLKRTYRRSGSVIRVSRWARWRATCTRASATAWTLCASATR